MSTTEQTSASKRIAALLDDNSFVEIGGFVTARNTDFNLQAKQAPADGVVTGYGTVEGNLVYVYSQDASVLGGTVGEMHAKKIVKLYDLAMKTGAPVVGLIDCAGLRLEEATDALNGFGEIYMSQAMASGVIPQITAVFGSCGGGMAVSAAMSDFTFMEAKNAKLFVNSPNTLDENYVSKCDTAAADFQSKEAGNVDVMGSEDEILSKMRELITILPANNEDDMSYGECEDDLNRVCESIENGVADPAITLGMISDDGYVFETKSSYAKDIVTGFIRLNGTTVGAVANRSVLFDEEGKEVEKFDGRMSAEGAQKAADFVNFCDAFEIPVLTLTNVNGYEATKCQEKKLAKAVASLNYAFANATVPKVNVVVGNAYGSAYVTMNSKAIGADVVYAWTDATIGMMDANLAAKIICENPDEVGAKAAEYQELQSSALAAAKRGYVDDIITPADTRKRVIAAFEMLFTKREDRPSKKHGTI